MSLARLIEASEDPPSGAWSLFSNDTLFAIKKIEKPYLRPGREKIESIKNEIEIGMHLRGTPGVVFLREAYEDENNVYLIMDYCPGGEFLDYLTSSKSAPPYTESKVCRPRLYIHI